MAEKKEFVNSVGTARVVVTSSATDHHSVLCMISEGKVKRSAVFSHSEAKALMNALEKYFEQNE